MRNLWMILACFAGLLVLAGLLFRPENLISILIGCGLLAISNRVKLQMDTEKQHQSWLNFILVAIGSFLIFIGLITLPYVSSTLLALVIAGLVYYALMQDKSSDEKQNLSIRQTKIVDAEEAVLNEKDKNTFLAFDHLFNNGPYTEEVYAWEDVEMYHLYANTFIDFGSTIVPVGTNVVVINQLLGQTKLVVPEGVGLELHANGFRTKVVWNGEQIALNNERKTFESVDYEQNNRKIYLQVSQGWGTIEVVFL